MDNTDSNQTIQVSSYMVRHNETIVGFYDTINDANDAVNGYTMDNDVQIDDALEVLKIAT